MEPDGDMEQLFIAPTGEDSEGQGGRKKSEGAARGGEKNGREQHVEGGGELSWSGIDGLIFKGALF